ncbi:MAG: hypothetical protein GC152_10445 [Alphaproteobacteria bacterium]|nr:hypothetical protein [Alphaproteobacteria bacterium]
METPSFLAGRRVAIATMHGKEQAIAPAFEQALGMIPVQATGINTDAFGMFSGEIERRGSVLETAVLKAREGMRLAGAEAGIASEGSYGAHPIYHFIPGGSEVMTYVDDVLGIVVSESLIVEGTNFSHIALKANEEPNEFLKKAGFPDHGVIVRANAPAAGHDPGVIKGVTDPETLKAALREFSAQSSDECARIETDMRAFFNPTRMGEIGRLAEKLAKRLAQSCPTCDAPGFGAVDKIAGLPCEDCGHESTLIRALVYGCTRCAHREERPRPDGLERSSPTYCLSCNP